MAQNMIVFQLLRIRGGGLIERLVAKQRNQVHSRGAGGWATCTVKRLVPAK
jgi:hypothetical protein